MLYKRESCFCVLTAANLKRAKGQVAVAALDDLSIKWYMRSELILVGIFALDRHYESRTNRA